MTKAVGLAWCGAVAAALGASAASASEIGHEIASAIDVAEYQYYLDELLYSHYGDDRGPYGPEHDPARDNVVAVFESFGFAVELHPFEWEGDTFYNVVATKPGVLWPDAQYVIGAHYDSVDNPGADDDGSGVAGLLELGRVFSQYDVGYTLEFIAFDLEERGLVGSEAYVWDHLTNDVRAMIQLDMIAWDGGAHEVYIDPAGPAACDMLADLLGAAVDEYGGDLTYVIDPAVTASSDHESFGDVGYRACVFIESSWYANPCYHEQCDSVDEPNYISYTYAADILRCAAGFLADHARAFHAGDCDDDGIPDEEQIAADPSLDCNGNGFLDECEPGGDQDCNGNGTPDLCDIFFGTSEDLDGDGTPDECQPHRYVPAEHPTIQAALDAADEGDVVVVADGTYSGDGNRNLTFAGKALLLRSENGPQNCVVDCAGEGTGIFFNSGEPREAALWGIKITGAGHSGIRCAGGSVPIISDCVILGNSAYNGAGIRCVRSRPRIVDCRIVGNTARTDGAGLYCSASCPTIVNCLFAENEADPGWKGGALYCYASAPMLQGCGIIGNTAYIGGAVCSENSAGLVLSACSFYGNSAGYRGGAVCSDWSTPALVNCAFTGNAADDSGGGIYSSDSTTRLASCTFSRNAAPSGKALACDSPQQGYPSTVEMRNCILWDGPNQIWNNDDSTITITYSNVRGGWDDEGNINTDPRFVDPLGPDGAPGTEDDDLRLSGGSPCIDAGDNDGVPPDTLDLDGDGDTDEPIPFDLDGNPRFVDDPGMPDCGFGTPPIVDMGAYESQGETCFGDLDGDRDVDWEDLTVLLDSYGTTSGVVYTDGDLDRDGDVDLADLAALLSVYGTTCE
jgi:hypothetical protein